MNSGNNIFLVSSTRNAEKVYNSFMNSIMVWYKMGTVFMNFENSKTSEPYRLSLNLVGKINVKRSDKYVALSNLSMYYTWRNYEKVIQKQ